MLAVWVIEENMTEEGPDASEYRQQKCLDDLLVVLLGTPSSLMHRKQVR